jgi:hypothetical protein
MSRLDIAAGQGPDNETMVEVLKTDEVVKKKPVKVAPADVTLLVCLPCLPRCSSLCSLINMAVG